MVLAMLEELKSRNSTDFGLLHCSKIVQPIKTLKSFLLSADRLFQSRVHGTQHPRQTLSKTITSTMRPFQRMVVDSMAATEWFSARQLRAMTPSWRFNTWAEYSAQ